MEETKEMQGAGEKMTTTNEEYGEILNELREFRELENMKAFLQKENAELKGQIEFLTGELEGTNIAISTAKADMVSCATRTKKSSENIDELESKRDILIAEINDFRLQIKAVGEDEESSSMLEDSLQNELNDILGEKAVVTKRFDDIKTGLQKISGDKAVKLPHLKGYDSALKQIRNVFQETQNRMEVSLMLRLK